MSKLGKGRKNKQKWKKPTGRDNKMREKKKGHRAVVSVGYRADKVSRGMVEQKVPVVIFSVKDLKSLRENEVPVLARVGQKKKIEIAKEAQKSDIKVHNLNVKKFLKEVEMKTKRSKSKKEEKKTEKKDESKKDSKENKTEDKNMQGTKSPTSSAEASSNEGDKK